MCSWCYGFQPVLDEVLEELDPSVAVRLVMGGLAPDSEEPMAQSVRAYVQEAWRTIASRTGVRFEHRFWEVAQPRRSTWPACRAVIAAGPLGTPLYRAIQRAYYREARDPSWPETLLELALEVGCAREPFVAAWGSAATARAFKSDLELRDRLGARGFPSVGLATPEGLELLTRGWCDADTLRAALAAKGLFAVR